MVADWDGSLPVDITWECDVAVVVVVMHSRCLHAGYVQQKERWHDEMKDDDDIAVVAGP